MHHGGIFINQLSNLSFRQTNHVTKALILIQRFILFVKEYRLIMHKCFIFIYKLKIILLMGGTVV